MSDAFQRGWDLVKMPIIPGSIREIDNPYNRFEPRMVAEFLDPETNEIFPMMSEIGPYGLETKIKDGKKRAAYSEISEHYGDEWMTSHAHTEPDYRRRGLMTAIYNLVNEMAKKKGARLSTFPSQLSEYSAPFWAKHMELPYEGDERRSAHTKFQDDYRGIKLRWPYDGVFE
tara:strand:- start:4704 stop:5219 length:516 start_codon:yes stop_codon:yes gene_type:complete